MRRIHRFAAATFGTALMLACAGPRADDTEIYFQTGGDLGGAPLVMFHLEYTSDLVSTICTGVTGQDETSLDDAGCSEMKPLSGYFSDEDLDGGTITLFEVIRAALKKVLAPLDGLKVGIMLSHAADNNCDGPSATGCSNGGYILQGFTEVDAPRDGFDPDAPDLDLVLYQSDGTTATAKKALFDKLDALGEPQGHLSHKNQNKEVYFELFRYLTGQGIHNAHNGWNDFGTSSDYNLGSADDTSSSAPDGTVALQWDTSIEQANGRYTSPLENCTRVFVINIFDGSGNSNNDSDDAIEASLNSGGMDIAVSNNDAGFVDVVRWMHDRDLADDTINNLDLEERQNVTSFFIAKQPQQVDTAAAAGGTGYALTLTDDPQDLLDTLDSVFNQILSVSTTFVSASIPVNVFNRSEVLDNVFIALFQTDPDNKPQWVGNIKKLKLATVTSGDSEEIQVRDANEDPAIAIDGRIKYEALTYWTDGDGWDAQLTPEDNDVAGKDGRSVSRGGAGQQIPEFLSSTVSVPGTPATSNGTGTRQLYTEPDSYTNGTAATLKDLDATATNAELLWPYLRDDASDWSEADEPPAADTNWTGAGSKDWSTAESITLQDEALNALKFARGIDVKDADGDGDSTDVRRWIFGDPLHSRPLPINYGKRGNYTVQDIRIIAGGNDGVVRMIRNTASDGTEDGSETWGFMPREALRVQKRLMDNVAGSGHPYGVDGAPAAYIYDANSDGTIDPDNSDAGDRVILFIGMRRGGHSYYALDISRPGTPKMLWSIKNSGNFSEMGLTFSTPRVQMLQWGNNDAKPVVIFAGGYDTNKDTGGTGTDDAEGNAIYIVEAETGALVWKAVEGATKGSVSATEYSHPDLDDSIPSDVTPVDTDGDGNMDRFYVGDTGGRVWRGDLDGTDRTGWQLTELLSVGRHSTGGTDRRFFHAPDFVPASDDTGDYDAVVIGSGDRANPLATDVDNWVYMVKDRATDSGSPPDSTLEHGDLDDVSDNCRQDDCSVSNTLADGWKMALEDSGEKMLSAPLTLTGNIYFSTYVPKSDSATCGPDEGGGWAYVIDLDDATAVFNYTTDNDITDPDTGDVTELFKEDRKRTMASQGIPSDPVFVRYDGISCIMSTDFTCKQDGKQAAWRTYWYQREE